MSDTELEEAFIAALADWLSSPGITTPPASLQRLSVAYSGRFSGHPARCTCEHCLELLDVEELLPWEEYELL